jgi:hypothetical protein
MGDRLGSTGRFSTKPDNDVQRLNATYNWPVENMPPVRSTTRRSSVCPWLLWIVIAHASLNGRCV